MLTPLSLLIITVVAVASSGFGIVKGYRKAQKDTSLDTVTRTKALIAHQQSQLKYGNYVPVDQINELTETIKAVLNVTFKSRSSRADIDETEVLSGMAKLVRALRTTQRQRNYLADGRELLADDLARALRTCQGNIDRELVKAITPGVQFSLNELIHAHHYGNLTNKDIDRLTKKYRQHAKDIRKWVKRNRARINF